MKIEVSPIGIIHSPFTAPDGMPIQPAGAGGVKGTVKMFEDFQAGLTDLDGFSHIILLYHFHRSQGFNLHVVPFMDSEPRGLFATRAPKRPKYVKWLEKLTIMEAKQKAWRKHGKTRQDR